MVPDLVSERDLISRVGIVEDGARYFKRAWANFYRRRCRPIPIECQIGLRIDGSDVGFRLIGVFHLLLSQLLPFSSYFSDKVSLG